MRHTCEGCAPSHCSGSDHASRTAWPLNSSRWAFLRIFPDMRFETSKDDIEFRRQIESCELPASDFNHRAHLRLAYIYLTENDPDRSVELMRDTLDRFLIHNGADPSKYHETITKAWILAVHHFMNKTGNSKSADDLIDKNPSLLDKNIMMTHYSAEVLFSDNARAEFVQPDLDPIPRHGE